MSDAAPLVNATPLTKLSPPEQLVYSTVRIECEYADGRRGTGTGFFFAFAREGDRFVPVIVTNKHVVKRRSAGRFPSTCATRRAYQQSANQNGILSIRLSRSGYHTLTRWWICACCR